MGEGITVRNVKAVNLELSKYGKRTQKAILKEIDISSLNIESKAKVRAPIDKGRLRSSIIRKKKKSGANISTNVEYAPPVELGSRPHVIEAKNFPVLGNKKVGFFGKKVFHPGTKARPFLFNSAKEEFTRLKQRINRAVKLYEGR